MRFFNKICIALFLLTGVAFIVLPAKWFPTYFDVPYHGWGMLVGTGLIYYLSHSLRVSPANEDDHHANHSIDHFQFVLSFALLGDTVGTFGLYQLFQQNFPFDKILHFITPLLSVVIFSGVLNARFRFYLKKAAQYALLTVLLSSVLWEVFEFTTDYIFKTHLSGEFGLYVTEDTKADLLFDFLGGIIGYAIILYRHKRSRIFNLDKSATAT